MLLADLRWDEVSVYLKEKDGLIIPIGMCEQHSKHLPLNTDTLVAEYICNYLSKKTKMLVAPTFNYGVGLPCDRFYPGSSSIQYEDLRNTILSLISWWKLQGFKKFFIISAHGDPFHLKALRESGYDRVFVLGDKQGTADCVKNQFGNYLLPLTPIINSIIGNSYIKIG